MVCSIGVGHSREVDVVVVAPSPLLVEKTGFGLEVGVGLEVLFGSLLSQLVHCLFPSGVGVGHSHFRLLFFIWPKLLLVFTTFFWVAPLLPWSVYY